MSKNMHDPVMLNEVVNYLTDAIAPLHTEVCIIDATLGFAGHAKEFVKRGIPIVGIDRDEKSLEYARKVLEDACPSTNNTNVRGSLFKLLHGNFKDIDRLVHENNIDNVYGILIDLGVSTWQLTDQERGLSFQNGDALLDMRLDQKTDGVTGYDLLNVLDKRMLMELFGNILDYPTSKRLTDAIVERRLEKPFRTVSDFLSVIPKPAQSKLHYATLPFMALRMAVNSELQNINEVLPKAFSILETGGRLAVISFHSKEDALVKEFMREKAKNGSGRVLTDKPIVPSEEELQVNPRSRSAKLRVIEKI